MGQISSLGARSFRSRSRRDGELALHKLYFEERQLETDLLHGDSVRSLRVDLLSFNWSAAVLIP